MSDTEKMKEAERVLAQVIYSRGSQLTSKEIAEIVMQFQPVYQFDQEDCIHLIRVLETQYVTTMGAGVSLIDPDLPHDEEWYLNESTQWSYWSDYEKLLINEEWPIRVISSIDTVTNKILGLLKNPMEEGEWERRGLVIGHVQSGKTANYIGLITKAADAGYKFIIVIAGVHNHLRTQTQERIDEGFVGRESAEKKNVIGVGMIRPSRIMPATVTTTESDFNKTVAKSFGIQLESLNNTFILVIKKNVSTLRNVYNWLKVLNTRKNFERISDIPMLLIDDEADNASINTNKPELDPTRTNREIRNILNLFRKRCYVGYTATPFANIFINPDDVDEMLGNNLFPEHFIYCLDAPTNYFGAEKIFLNEDSDNPFVIEIDDAEEYIPLKHKKDDPIEDLPPSLKKAIRLFVLSRVIRNLRGHDKKHCSMLINTSRFVSVQREVKQLTELYVEQLKRAVRYNYRLPTRRALEDEFMFQLYKDYSTEYLNCGLSWESVQAELNESADAIKLFLVNSKSEDALNYKAYAKEDRALTAIAIGGLSLSRGLTIEGLTVSYIYRNSKMYDTLMQMGRWFGYRDEYEDICRIFMSEVSNGWYSHIAEATEELRTQIKRMRREGKKPSDFGLYVRAHPDSLIVTAMNKMRYTSSRTFQVSYDGKLLETHIIPSSVRKNTQNRQLFIRTFEALQASKQAYQDSTGSYLFQAVEWQDIQDFVLRFSFHTDLTNLREHIPDYIQQVSDLYRQWDIAFKSPAGKAPTDGYMIAAQERNIGHEPSKQTRVPPSEPGWYVGNKNKVSGNSMFEIGLTEEQRQRAAEIARDAGRENPIYSDYTNARGKPLLMLHLLDLVDKNNGNDMVIEMAPALSVSFPNSNEFRTIEYVVGPVWLRQFEQDGFDYTSQEDDYDLE